VKGRYLETLTWPEAEQALESFPTVLLPLGARTKEHGPHLPLNNDWLIAEYLASRVAERSEVLILPTLQYGYYPAFVEYPGSVSVRWEACRDTVVDICLSLARHGAKRFYVLNTGISTARPLQAAQEVVVARGIKMEFTDIGSAYAGLRRQVETQPAGTHADEVETSMMLYIAPEVVKHELAERDIHPDKGPGGLTRQSDADEGVYSPTGSYGDPTLATAEKGRVLVEGMVQYLVDYLEAFAREELPHPAPETLPSL
jgi:creatinine amidohydrolase